MAKRKRTAFVPRLVFRIAIAGVVPACVAACSSGGIGGPNDAAPRDMRLFGVADQFFSVAAPLDFSMPQDGPMGVADLGFGDLGDGGPDDGGQDQFFTVAAPLDFAVTPQDQFFAVADVGFPPKG
jgi:hypothetical protein